MEWSQVEPVGRKECPECGKTVELLAEHGDLDDARCPKCMHEKYGDEFLEEWVIGAGVVVEEPEVDGERAIYDYGYGLFVEFSLKTSEMPASRNPNETKTIRVKETSTHRATVSYHREELGIVEARDWANYTDDFLYPD